MTDIPEKQPIVTPKGVRGKATPRVASDAERWVDPEGEPDLDWDVDEALGLDRPPTAWDDRQRPGANPCADSGGDCGGGPSAEVDRTVQGRPIHAAGDVSPTDVTVMGGEVSHVGAETYQAVPMKWGAPPSAVIVEGRDERWQRVIGYASEVESWSNAAAWPERSASYAARVATMMDDVRTALLAAEEAEGTRRSVSLARAHGTLMELIVILDLITFDAIAEVRPTLKAFDQALAELRERAAGT